MQMKRSFYSALFLAALLAASTHAATVTMDVDSLTSGTVAWTESSLWDTGSAPGANDDVIIGTCGFSGAATCAAASGSSIIDLGSLCSYSSCGFAVSSIFELVLRVRPQLLTHCLFL